MALPYRKATYEDYVGVLGLDRFGKKKWRTYALDVSTLLSAAFEPDDVVLGGGNVKMMEDLPPLCRTGDNANAFKGRFRLLEPVEKHEGNGKAIGLTSSQTSLKNNQKQKGS